MSKKVFCLALCALLLALSVPVEAQQQPKIPRVGFLDPGHPGPGVAFRQGLSDLGYLDGRTSSLSGVHGKDGPIGRLRA